MSALLAPLPPGGMEIVDFLREDADGLSIDRITERFQEHSREKIRDALESAIEDEYIERIWM
ncbi:hypothetical protein EU524_00210 [Candidatus Thorarchaeota archaeon]|nr:MAG: hypothetical protein EU524_00210 [Candidatus Thorarchaeota archaeon]